MNKHNLKLDWCSHKAAKYACEHWHYSKCMPVGKTVKIGVWENDKFIGVVVFSRGANRNMLKPFGLKADQGCELTRIALTKHKFKVSRILTIAIKYLKKSNNLLQLIVSYSDQDQNHHGGIYQATNWVYDGLKNKGTKRAFIINGKKTHPKSVYSKGIKQNIESVRKYLDKNATIFITEGKHRYLMPLTKEMRKKIELLAKPYPKREPVEENQTPSDLGGATPTVTLQIQEASNG